MGVVAVSLMKSSTYMKNTEFVIISDLRFFSRIHKINHYADEFLIECQIKLRFKILSILISHKRRILENRIMESKRVD
jgi:hypothetical protein